jgi:ADP-heptose:LPS heptosyltransferase
MEYLFLLASAFTSRLVNLLGAFRRRRPTKVLVVKLDHLGDVVTATPVFRSLRRGLPGAPIHVMVGPWAKDLLAGNPCIDRILTYDAGAFHRAVSPRADGRHPFRVMRETAAERYTHIIDLRGDGWTLLLPFLSGAIQRLDRGTVRLSHWIRSRTSALGARGQTGLHGARAASLHEVETNLLIVRPLVGSSAAEETRVEVFTSESDRAAIGAKLRGLGIQEGDLIVTIHAGASWRPRAWYPERFAEVARGLLERHPMSILFVGGEEERDIAERIRPLVPNPRVHFLFGSRLAETEAVIERSALFIGNDSGLAHIAAACGTPVVALYGPQDPKRFRPWSAQAIVLHKPVHCFPCRQIVCVHPELPCVNLISVAEVMERAEAFLDRAVPRRAAT